MSPAAAAAEWPDAVLAAAAEATAAAARQPAAKRSNTASIGEGHLPEEDAGRTSEDGLN